VRRNKNDIREAFGEKAYLVLKIEGQMVGVAGWQVENLVARTDDIYLQPDLPLRDVLRTLTEEIERESRELQCEIALVFLSKDLLQKQDVWRTLGYQKRTVDSLGVRAWQEAAMESLTTDTTMFFKQLRKDRVLRPV
jgi:dephospho-CoA kinase